jgi:hypothetical protein
VRFSVLTVAPLRAFVPIKTTVTLLIVFLFFWVCLFTCFPIDPSLPPIIAPAASSMADNQPQDIDSLNEDAQILQKNYKRFEATLLDSLDRQCLMVKDKLSESNILLKRTQEEKNKLGVHLYQSKVENNRINERLLQSLVFSVLILLTSIFKRLTNIGKS